MDRLQEFEQALSNALNHLYDLDYLARSPLVAVFGLEGADTPGTALTSLIEEAIQALKPEREVPANARNRRYHQLLAHRYLELRTQEDTARILGISPRHLRREQDKAVQVLVRHLSAYHRLFEAISPPDDRGTADEFSWLAESMGGETADVALVMQEVTRLVGGLARAHAVRPLYRLEGRLPSAALPATVLKQVLLNLLSAAIPSVPQGEMVLSASRGDYRINVCLAAKQKSGPSSWRVAWNQEGVETSRRLLALFQCDLAVEDGPDTVTARVSLRRADRVLVLAVEDNADTLQLWRRFVHNTRFHLVGVAKADQTLSKALALRPRVIVLDIMLPDVDGWELLGQLQQHAQTAHIPVVVCTVLPQEDLARSVGASGFLRKPITGREFRAQLERQIEVPDSGR